VFEAPLIAAGRGGLNPVTHSLGYFSHGQAGIPRPVWQFGENRISVFSVRVGKLSGPRAERTQRRAFARAPEAVADMDDFDPTVTNSPKFRLIAVQCVSAPSAPPHVHVERAPRVGRQKEAPRDRRVVTPASHPPRSLDVPIDAPARLMHVLIHR
jgi:hypothetical protein